MDPNPSSSKVERKTVEKNRRDQMKALYSELNRLVSPHSSTETASLPDQLEGATNYIKMLEANLEEMKQKKQLLEGIPGNSRSGGPELPKIDIRVLEDSALEVALVTGQNCQFMFNEVIRILHEEGADVINATFSAVEDTVFHTIHSKIGESSHDYGAAKISERLRKFVYGFS